MKNIKKEIHIKQIKTVVEYRYVYNQKSWPQHSKLSHQQTKNTTKKQTHAETAGSFLKWAVPWGTTNFNHPLDYFGDPPFFPEPLDSIRTPSSASRLRHPDLRSIFLGDKVQGPVLMGRKPLEDQMINDQHPRNDRTCRNQGLGALLECWHTGQLTVNYGLKWFKYV